MDTIYALATAPGRAGVSVFRLSGPKASDIAALMVGSVPEARGLRRVRNGDGEILDEALILRFAQNRSFTGEEVVEFHLHGSVAVAAAVSNRFASLGARLAEPGEFTRRALENGRLDLAQVEGLADLIDAETEAQRKQALAVFSGVLGDLAETWRKDLIRAAALVEATIDFVDEDVPVNVYPEVNALLDRTTSAMSQQIIGVGAAERIRNGFEVAIVGRPNVGKSTLLNRLAGRAAAITSEVAGTTRDIIEVRMDLGGLPVTLLDTAGMRETDDIIESLGVQLALDRAQLSDLRVFLIEEDRDLPLEPLENDIVVRAKVDDGGEGVSGLTGHGVDELVQKITRVLSQLSAGAGIAIRDRHRHAMEKALVSIRAAEELIVADGPPDLIAEDLRSATRAVDMIVGRVDVEDLLDEIFSSFCIGK
ncbi:MAG: tRNA modification GTPase [Loktanella salsilacus]|jgi:tRNA modification GTPase|uniref:tRNA uridine-5-carboxymethylaminomethyl(34) synthesis GTPase MnmE n=1 Tax=Loktanella salsilacus TaxID=195913 RepID=UPI0020B6908F|nr:tRNA uridine-5-carboxymethylaminomethyl(34) synthesis GTPase MnmE [Loktanella salsilacus]UTH44390.1 tRNA uridine-5-carboxymethylaminomethyl(34) synthesis GTPase MnmE [Loktanella salsilacus]